MSDLGKVVPTEIRARIAEVLGDELSRVVATVLNTLEADHDRYVTCTNCKHKGIYLGPDYRTRLEAAKTLVELGIGKAKPAELDPEPTGLDQDISTLSPTERTALARTLSSRFPSVAARLKPPPSQARPPQARATRPSQSSDEVAP